MWRFVLAIFAVSYFTASFNTLHAQAPTVNLSFDDCDAVNSGPNSPDGDVMGDPDCVCGVFGQAFKLDGAGESISIEDTSALDLLTFSIAFYFQPERGMGDYVVLSQQEDCNSLLGFNMIYRDDMHQLEIEVTQEIGRRVILTAALSESKCWHHVIFERSGGRHSVFIDGNGVGEVNSGGLINFFNRAPITIGSGPCVPDFANSMKGIIDEFRIYDRILNVQEKFQLRRETQQILTSDAVILVGEEVEIEVSDDCTQSYSWSPSFGVADPNMGNTTIAPQETETYFLEFTEFNCRVRDSITIIIVDPDDVTCDDLALPNAFTPNEDGLNDEFFISNPFLIEELRSFEIFDRNGATMFRTTSLNEAWDGSFRGEPVNPGVYLYKVEYQCNGEIFLKTGQVAIVR